MFRCRRRRNQHVLIQALSFTVLACVFQAVVAGPGPCGDISAHADGIAHPKFDPQLNALIQTYIDGSKLIPGMAVAIVEGDRITFARGYGYRDLERCLPVDLQTGFYLKSTTKSYLGLAAAILSEEGLVDLDAPIADYLPELKLPEGVNAQHVSLRSHFTHTQPYFDAGLNYRTAFPGNLPESQWVEHINAWAVERAIAFRYSNFGPVIGALAIMRRTGEHWRDLIENRVFEPLGMNSSTTDIARAEAGNYGRSYLPDGEGDFSPTRTKVQSQMHPAGGAVSSVMDLAKFVTANLNDGMAGDGHRVPKRAVEHAQSRQVYLDWDFLETHRFAHGLGLYSADYKGDVLMHHFGGETHMSFLPEHGIGVIVLTNAISDGVEVTHRLALSIYDLLLGRPKFEAGRDARIEEIRAAVAQSAERLEQYVANLRDSAPRGTPTLDLPDLQGMYGNARLGNMQFRVSGHELQLTYGVLSGPLEHVGGDVYLAHFSPWGAPPERFEFRKDDSGALVMDWGGRLFVRKEHVGSE